MCAGLMEELWWRTRVSFHYEITKPYAYSFYLLLLGVDVVCVTNNYETLAHGPQASISCLS